jgi:hypothetical protein
VATKREVEDRLKKYRAELEACKAQIKILEDQLEEAQSNQLTPEAARAILDENDDLVIATLLQLQDYSSRDRKTKLKTLTAYMQGKTLSEFLESLISKGDEEDLGNELLDG